MLQQIISHNEPIKVIHEAWEGGYSGSRAACERITLTKLGREQNSADVIGMRQAQNHVPGGSGTAATKRSARPLRRPNRSSLALTVRGAQADRGSTVSTGGMRQSVARQSLDRLARAESSRQCASSSADCTRWALSGVTVAGRRFYRRASMGAKKAGSRCARVSRR